MLDDCVIIVSGWFIEYVPVNSVRVVLQCRAGATRTCFKNWFDDLMTGFSMTVMWPEAMATGTKICFPLPSLASFLEYFQMDPLQATQHIVVHILGL